MVSLQETGGRVRRMHLSLSTVFLPMDFSGGDVQECKKVGIQMCQTDLTNGD